MSSVLNHPWNDPHEAVQAGAREFAVQLGRMPSGFLLARCVVRTPTWTTEMERRGGAGWVMTIHDLTSLVTTGFDALCREATILGGVQLTLE